MQVTSNHESAEEISAALKPEKEESPEPRVLVDKGKPVEEPDEVSEAAAKLGKKGGEAAAAARKAKPIPDKPKEEAKPVEEPEPEKAARGTDAREGDEDEEEDDTDLPLTENARKRIEKATKKEAAAKRELREAQIRHERELSETRSRLEMLERSRTEPQPKEQPRAAQPTRTKPEAADFESYDGYVDALTDWKIEQREAKAAERNYERAVVTGVTQAEHQFATHVKEAFQGVDLKERLSPDVLYMVPSYRLTPDQRWGPDNVIADEFLRAGKLGPRLMEYLSDNPTELQRLRKLRSSEDVQIEMRVIARTIGPAGDATPGNPPAAQGSGSKPELSKAKPLVPPVTGSPHTADELDDTAPLSAFVKRFGQRELAKLKR